MPSGMMKELLRGRVHAGMISMVRSLVLVLLAAGTTLSPLSAATADRPNIVFIMADDLGWADVDFHGGNAPTPHLDKLRREGVELTQHYVAPVCSPTRSALLSGRFWSRFGVTTPQNERAYRWDTVTLPRALQSLGYATCLTGKWHLGSKPEWGPNHFGFDHSYGSLAGGVGPWNHFYKKGEFSVTWHRNEKLLTEEGHVTDLITDEAITWLKSRDPASPFFLYVPYTAVHLPVKEPQPWLAKVPAQITGDVARHYAACIMHLDDAVGRIVAALETLGQRERTLLVFTSDNGGSDASNSDSKYPEDAYPKGPLPGSNKPLRGKKGDVYEGGIRVPCLLSWPGRLLPGNCQAPVHISDWMPTFCSLAGYRPAKDLHWDGQDMWPVITGAVGTKPRVLYWTAPNFRSKAVRDCDWKLVVTGKPGDETVELFDLAKDPNETRDLAPDMPDKVSTMKSRLAEVSRQDQDAVAND